MILKKMNPPKYSHSTHKTGLKQQMESVQDILDCLIEKNKTITQEEFVNAAKNAEQKKMPDIRLGGQVFKYCTFEQMLANLRPKAQPEEDEEHQVEESESEEEEEDRVPENFNQLFIEGMKMLAEKKGGEPKFYTVVDNDNHIALNFEDEKISVFSTIFKAKNIFELWLKVYEFCEKNNDHHFITDLVHIKEYVQDEMYEYDYKYEDKLYLSVDNEFVRMAIYHSIECLDEPDNGIYVECYNNFV